MKNTFLNRVSAERRVLALVNAKLSSKEQLAGLSQAAIHQWRVLAGLNNESPIISILTTLAKNCQRLSDRSNETFLPLDKTASEKIEKQLSVLKRELEGRLNG